MDYFIHTLQIELWVSICTKAENQRRSRIVSQANNNRKVGNYLTPVLCWFKPPLVAIVRYLSGTVIALAATKWEEKVPFYAVKSTYRRLKTTSHNLKSIIIICEININELMNNVYVIFLQLFIKSSSFPNPQVSQILYWNLERKLELYKN